MTITALTSAQLRAAQWQMLMPFEAELYEHAELLEISVDGNKRGLAQIDSIPSRSSRVHLYDWVRYQYDYDGERVFVEVVEPSGYQTMRVSVQPWNFSFDAELAFARVGIRRHLKAIGLEFHTDVLLFDRIVAAVPPSYNLARIEVLKLRFPDLRFELV